MINFIKDFKKIDITILSHPLSTKIKKYKESFIKVCDNNKEKYPLIYDADVVIGMSSSLLVESSLIGKTTIAFLESKKNFKRNIFICV